MINKLNGWMSRYIPDAFIIALFLSLIVFGAAYAATPASIAGILQAWGDGFWSLLSFAMQMSLVMLTGFIVSHSPLMKRALRLLAALAQGPRLACVFMALFSMLLSWIHWGLGLVGSSVMLRFFALQHPKTHYPLLVACAYFGLGSLWHAGLSASAPLLAATPGHFMEKEMGIIPMSATVFSPWNLATSAIIVLSLSGLVYWLYPKKENEILACPPETLKHFGQDLSENTAAPTKIPAAPAQRLEQSYAVNFIAGGLGLAYLGLALFQNSWNFNLDRFNFIFFFVSLLLHPNIKSFLEAASEGAKTITGIVLQFPLYAGLFGVIKTTGLSEILARGFVSLASKETYLLVVYFYSGILNYFIPSGGSKWAIEAPYLYQAAQAYGIGSDKLILAYAWGDMATDLIQPFWCLPVLAAAKMEFRHIMGYLSAAFAVNIMIAGAAVLILGFP